MEKKNDRRTGGPARCHGCGLEGEKPAADSLSLPRGWVFELHPWPWGGSDMRPMCPLCQRSRFPEYRGQR